MDKHETHLRIEGLAVGHDDIPILEGVTLSAYPGEVVGIVGGNGSGKSTFLQTLAGLLSPLGGQIMIGGENVVGKSVLERVRDLKFGYLPQHGRRIPNLTINENLHLAQWDCGSRAERMKNIEMILSQKPFTQLRGHRHELAGALSGGQNLLLALAALSLQNSRLILLDEPSDGLDEYNRSLVVELIAQMKSGDRIILVVEQLLRVVFSISDRVYVAGQLTPQRVLQSHTLRPNVGRLRELETGKIQTIRELYARHPSLRPADTQTIDSLLWETS